jgi:hypothetical protein
MNISPTIDIPGDHWDIPPKSGWLNCAMLPPLDRSACRLCELRPGILNAGLRRGRINPSSFNGMVSVQFLNLK